MQEKSNFHFGKGYINLASIGYMVVHRPTSWEGSASLPECGPLGTINLSSILDQ